MQINVRVSRSILAVMLVVLAGSLAFAQTLNIPVLDRGWYDETGFHDWDNLNYFVGDHRGPSCGACLNDYRNFFVFDLSGISKPIAYATLALFVPGAPGGYGSFDPSETYELHDVITPLATLLAGTGGESAHADLGSGAVHGRRAMTAADRENVGEITLNPFAVAAMNSNHGLFGIGGSIATLDAAANNEFTFSDSDRWGTGTTELRLTLVPEPSTFFLLAIGAISLLGYRRAKSDRRER